MKKILPVLLTLLVSTVNLAAGGSLDPLPGSCRAEAPNSDNWCHCQFVSSIDGSRHSGEIHCSVLSCFHYRGWQQNEDCQGPREALCTLRHRGYAGACRERVALEIPSQEGANDACTLVLSCLNNPLCVSSHCAATTLRGGWTLESSVPVDPGL